MAERPLPHRPLLSTQVTPSSILNDLARVKWLAGISMLHEINLWASVPLGQCVESVGRVCTTWLVHARQSRRAAFVGVGLFGWLLYRNNIRYGRTSQDDDAPRIGCGSFI